MSCAIKINPRIQNLDGSCTIMLADRVRQLRREGRDIIGLTVGEPDFDTPFNIRAAAIEAIHNGMTHYTDVMGTKRLREAICHRLAEDYNLAYESDDILVSAGAKHSLANCLYAMLEPGDEVIIPAPYWVSYPGMVELYGGKPVTIETSIHQHFKITPEQLEQAITERTVAFILNSPSNPSGMIYSHDELCALANVLLQHPHVAIISDDIYSKLIWEDQSFANLAMVEPALKDRTVVISGASKGYAMTGWRLGYAAGPRPLIKTMAKIQSQSTSCICSIAQAAGTEAFEGEQATVTDMIKSFKERHDMVLAELQSIEGVHVEPAQGAFYLFPDISALLKRMEIDDDITFTNFLLEVANVAVVPGSAFGSPNHFRISVAASMDQLNEALKRIKDAIGEAA